MFAIVPQLNFLAVLMAFFFYSVVGGLWFTVLFKKQYMDALGWDSNKPLPQSLIFIIGPAICTLVIIFSSAILLKTINIETYGELLAFIFIVGIGYLVANTVTIAINPNIPRPMYYSFITGCYHLVGFTAAVSILYVMS